LRRGCEMEVVMSVTVADCLAMHPFEGANVIAGKGGRFREVHSCTVLEWSNIEMFKAPYFRNGDVVITSFYSEKDNTERQCAIIRQLHNIDAAALVLFHVGTIVFQVDQKLIDLSNELDFPLIVMPAERDVGYSEVIDGIMGALLYSRTAELHLTQEVLQRFYAMSELQKNFRTLLELIGQYTDCSLVLADQMLEVVTEYQSPKLLQLDPEFFSPTAYIDKIPYNNRSPYKIKMDNNTVLIHIEEVTRKNTQPLFLLFVTTRAELDPYLVKQAVEAVVIADEIWHLSANIKNTSSTLRQLIDSSVDVDVHTVPGIQKFLSSDNTLLYIRQEPQPGKDNLQAHYLLKTANAFFTEEKRAVLLDRIDEAIIAIVHRVSSTEHFDDTVVSLCEYLEGKNMPAKMAVVPLDSAADVRDAYFRLRENWTILTAIFPLRMHFNDSDLHLADECHRCVKAGEKMLVTKMRIIDPLRVHDERQFSELLQTLIVFYLDAEGSTKATADLMYVHNNTVKYRIRKAHELLSDSVFKLPGAFYLYKALALSRITST
jgi:hypothetical protein